MKPSRVLRRAADIINARGWCQGALVKAGKVDVSAALAAAACKQPDEGYRWCESSLTAYVRLTQDIGMPVPIWNDSRDQTKRAVMVRLVSLAKRLEKNGE